MVPANPICKNKAAGLAIGRYSPTLKQFDIERVIARNLLKTSHFECSACGGVVGVVLIYQCPKARMGNPCIPTISRDLITGEKIGTLKTASNLVPFLSVPGP
jgi:hypothetical protein